MAVGIDATIVSGRDIQTSGQTNGGTKRAANGTSNGNVIGNHADGDVAQTTTETVKATSDASRKVRIRRKYRHVAAVHSEPKTSCLSHDSTVSPSFVGFRNLMVIVLVVGNLRLMIENYKKVCLLLSRVACPLPNMECSMAFSYASAAMTTDDKTSS